MHDFCIHNYYIIYCTGQHCAFGAEAICHFWLNVSQKLLILFQCSYSPCSQDSMQNADNVRAFLRNRHVGDSLRCFYDNTNPYNIIEEKPEVYLLRWDFFPFVVIVGVVALMCWFIVFLVCCLYGCVDCCIFIKENNRLCPQKRPRGDSYN